MITYRIEERGQCQLVAFPTHTHFIHMVRQHDLDHILYYPRGDGTSFVAYLSLTNSIMFILLPIGCKQYGSSSLAFEQLGGMYRWILQNRATHAYPFLQLDTLTHLCMVDTHRNEQHLRAWCDMQIDAFTFFQTGL